MSAGVQGIPRGPTATGSVDGKERGRSEVVSHLRRMRARRSSGRSKSCARAAWSVEWAALAEFVDEYLAQHEASPVTLGKLRFLLDRAVAAFGDYRLDELDPVEIPGRRMTVRIGYWFEATEALRKVLAREVIWGLRDANAARQGVENARRRRTEKRPVRVLGGDALTRGSVRDDGAVAIQPRQLTESGGVRG